MTDLIKFGKSLEESLAIDNLKERVTELGDLALEQLVENIDGVPILSIFGKIAKSYGALRNYFFMEKVIKYLTEVANIPPELRQKTIHRIESDSEYGTKFGKTVLLIIDRFDDDLKAYHLARAYKLLAEEQITLEFYLRFGAILDGMSLFNIKSLMENSFIIDGHPANSNLEKLGLCIRIVKIFDIKNPTSSINADKYKIVTQYGYSFTSTGQVVSNILAERPIFYRSKYNNIADFNKHESY